MRLEQFLRLKRGDVLTHEKEQNTIGLVVNSSYTDEPYVYVLWEDGKTEVTNNGVQASICNKTERYKSGDAPHLWLW